MAFERIQQLGQARFSKVLNALLRGAPAKAVAREIQQPPPEGWGELQSMSENALTLHLQKLRRAVAEGVFGEEAAKKIAAGATPQIKLMEKISVRALERLEELSSWQRSRLIKLMEREQILKFGYDKTDAVVEGYRKVLLDLQKIRFDLGLDEFKGPAPGLAVRGVSQTTTYPDGMNVQKQVFEAVNSIERIFDAKKIAAIRDQEE